MRTPPPPPLGKLALLDQRAPVTHVPPPALRPSQHLGCCQPRCLPRLGSFYEGGPVPILHRPSVCGGLSHLAPPWLLQSSALLSHPQGSHSASCEPTCPRGTEPLPEATPTPASGSGSEGALRPGPALGACRCPEDCRAEPAGAGLPLRAFWHLPGPPLLHTQSHGKAGKT